MDPITIAMGLAQFAPQIVKWVTGSSKAAEAATQVVEIAKVVTGRDQGPLALSALQADPALALQFRQSVMAQEVDLDKLYLADVQSARDRDVSLAIAGRRNIRADVMVGVAFIAVLAIAALMVLGGVDGGTAAGGFLATIGGMFARNIGTAFDFEFGSSRGSQNKDESIATALRKLP